jgi:tRNA dimethylallyltransferase
MQYIGGKLSLDQAIQAAQQGHRNYAKRQMTWFRREPALEMIDISSPAAEEWMDRVAAQATAMIKRP